MQEGTLENGGLKILLKLHATVKFTSQLDIVLPLPPDAPEHRSTELCIHTHTQWFCTAVLDYTYLNMFLCMIWNLHIFLLPFIKL